MLCGATDGPVFARQVDSLLPLQVSERLQIQSDASEPRMSVMGRRKAMLSRRDVLKAAAKGTASIAFPVLTLSDFAAAQELGADKDVEDWMNGWMKDQRPPVGGLHVTRFKEAIWVLTKPISWVPAKEDEAKYYRVDVPVGFVTDFASIPRPFWTLLPRDGEYTYPAIIHDYLYWFQTQSKEAADDILKIGMEEFQVDYWKVLAIYEGVKLGGRSSWDKNAKLRERGERRVLKEWPDDPRTSWEDWRKRPGVFVR
jgi:Protein of unknown function (DUF1353)